MLGLNSRFKAAFSNLFVGLPLEPEGDSFSPKLSYAAAIVGLVLQMQCWCPAEPQACLALYQPINHSMVGKDTLCPDLFACLLKNIPVEALHLLRITIWVKSAL